MNKAYWDIKPLQKFKLNYINIIIRKKKIFKKMSSLILKVKQTHP